MIEFVSLSNLKSTISHIPIQILFLGVLKASKKFKLDPLVEICEQNLITCVNVKNCVKFYQLADEIGVENLRKANKRDPDDDSLPFWKFGRAIDVMYNAGGISIDWAHKDVGIDLVYTLEMRDSGLYGFLLPDDQIEPAFREVWSGLSAVLLAYAEDLHRLQEQTATEATTTAEPATA